MEKLRFENDKIACGLTFKPSFPGAPGNPCWRKKITAVSIMFESVSFRTPKIYMSGLLDTIKPMNVSMYDFVSEVVSKKISLFEMFLIQTWHLHHALSTTIIHN